MHVKSIVGAHFPPSLGLGGGGGGRNSTTSLLPSPPFHKSSSRGVGGNDGMSLFQDLKLKRRKVDSRCSSDGESVGTSDSAASLSPDAAPPPGEASPKDKERCLTPEDMGKGGALRGGPTGFPPQAFIFMIKPQEQSQQQQQQARKLNSSYNSKTNGVIKHLPNGSSWPGGLGALSPPSPLVVVTNGESRGSGQVVVVKAEPQDHHENHLENGKCSPKGSAGSAPQGGPDKSGRRSRSPSPEKRKTPPLQNGRSSSRSEQGSPASSHPGSDSEGSKSSKAPPNGVIKMPPVTVTVKTEKDVDMGGHVHVVNGNGGGQPSPVTSSSSMSPPPLVPRPRSTNSPQNSNNSGSSSTGAPSPLSSLSSPGGSGSTLTITKQHNNNNQSHKGGQRSPPGSNNSMSMSRVPSPQHHPYHHFPHQNHLHARLTGQSVGPPGGGGATPSSMPSPLALAQMEHLRALNGHGIDAKSSDTQTVVTSTSLSFHNQSPYRINGVRPEVISGGAVTPTTASSALAPPALTYTHSSPTTSLTNGHGGGGGPIRKSPTLSSHHSHSRSPNSSPQSNSSSCGGGGGSSQNLVNGSMHSPMSGGGTIVAGGSLGVGGGLQGGPNGTGPGHHHHVNLNRTPTVVLGEAGGVRTMFWSQPGQNLPSELGLSPPIGLGAGQQNNHYGLQNGHSPLGGHPLTNGSGGSVNGSSSASSSPPHSLATPLGHHAHHHSNNNNNNHIHHKGGLSMEKLWATEALNLSTGGGSNSSSSGRSNAGDGHGHGHRLGHGIGMSPSLVGSHHRNSSGSGASEHSLSNGSLGGHDGSGGSGSHHSMGGLGSLATPSSHPHPEDDDYEQPMICMICEDRATGLHYGIITCEGCKGFFKRTVQNRRVYTCVADGTCEITKAQRNRCQYCRFKKCIEQGMVLQAVREDRMPGGRNSGAVYNLYKVPVKYRKHKKGNRGGAGGAGGGAGTGGGVIKGEKLNNANHGLGGGGGANGLLPPPTSSCPPSLGGGGGGGSMTGNILKTALTSPNEVSTLRPSSMPFETAAAMISHLVQCDNVRDIAGVQNFEELFDTRGDLSDKLCQMGDSIVYSLVQWTKTLPFYQEVPVEVHTRVLTHKWHELLVLTTSAWQAMNSSGPPMATSVEEETLDNLKVLQHCLQGMMGRTLTLDQLRQDVGQMVERLTSLTRSFRRIGIRMEEYVTLKVIAMLQNTGTKSNEVGVIQERYVKCLRTYLEVRCPSHPNRLNDLLRTLTEVQAAASLLLESKMFYVPFLLNTALIQR